MGYWHGSGTLGHTITREIVCAERCGFCEDNKITCASVWEKDFETDDWGNVEQELECQICKHTYVYREETGA